MRVGAGAAAGVAQSMLIPHNKPLSAAVCVAVGAAIAPDFGMVAAALPPGAGGLIVAGGVAYAVGALTYALRWPNPFPLSFGYHEVFHALVVLAGGLHFAAVHIVAHAVKGKGAGRV
jgi:hemolysin III